MDKGVWWAVIHRVAKSWTCCKQLSTHTHSQAAVTITIHVLWTLMIQNRYTLVLADQLSYHVLVI